MPITHVDISRPSKNSDGSLVYKVFSQHHGGGYFFIYSNRYGISGSGLERASEDFQNKVDSIIRSNLNGLEPDGIFIDYD